MFTKKKGFSLVEMLLAGAVFTVFAWGVVEVLLTGLSLNRLGAETTLAKEYASAGIEAVQSIKSADFTALENTESTGLEHQDGDWVFAGTENTFDKYTRRITVSEVSRDSGGNIVESGGDVDEDTKKITVSVTWDFTASRSHSVTLDTYLTRWEE